MAEPTLGPRFLGRWTAATFLGWTLGFAAVLLLLGLTGLIGLGDTQFQVGLGMGLGVGLVQARRSGAVARPGAWIAASAIGMAAPFVLYDIAHAARLGVPWTLPAGVVAGGLVTGLLQWRILRRQWRRAGWWVPASAAGWSLGAATILFNERYLPRIPGLAGAALYVGVVLCGGVLLGVVGGATLGAMAGRQ